MIQPTWLLHRSVYEAAGPYNETGLGTPEDLLFFYNHLARGGKLLCVDQPLLVYRHHPQAASQRVNRWVRQSAAELFVVMAVALLDRVHTVIVLPFHHLATLGPPFCMHHTRTANCCVCILGAGVPASIGGEGPVPQPAV